MSVSKISAGISTGIVEIENIVKEKEKQHEFPVKVCFYERSRACGSKLIDFVDIFGGWSLYCFNTKNSSAQ
jgi:hypothetical protein